MRLPFELLYLSKRDFPQAVKVVKLRETLEKKTKYKKLKKEKEI